MILYAGKALSDDEITDTARLVAFLRRVDTPDSHDDADRLERFLPGGEPFSDDDQIRGSFSDMTFDV